MNSRICFTSVSCVGERACVYVTIVHASAGCSKLTIAQLVHTLTDYCKFVDILIKYCTF